MVQTVAIRCTESQRLHAPLSTSPAPARPSGEVQHHHLSAAAQLASEPAFCARRHVGMTTGLAVLTEAVRAKGWLSGYGYQLGDVDSITSDPMALNLGQLRSACGRLRVRKTGADSA